MNLSVSPSFPSIPTSPFPNLQHKPHSSSSFFSRANTLSICRTLIHCSLTREGSKPCECFDLYNEVVPYREAWSWQNSIVKQKKSLVERNEDCPDTLIILQHNPVFTMGTSSSEKYLKFDINDAPYDVYRTERGGEVTYHGPGQLVMYPIINLRNHKMDLQWYLRALEEVIIRVLSSTFSIEASRQEGLTGVWVGDQKLAAIGIRVSRWITYHGLALNVTTDLTPFHWIVPCGIQNRQVGSIKGLLSNLQPSIGHREHSIHNFDDCMLIDIAHESLIKQFSEVFQVEIQKKNHIPSRYFQRENYPASSYGAWYPSLIDGWNS